MRESFEGIFELLKHEVKLPVRGAPKLKIILRMGNDKEIEKELIEFRREMIQATITQAAEPEIKSAIVTLELKSYTLVNIISKPMKPNDMLDLVLEGEWTKALERNVVDLKFCNIKLFMVPENQELDFEDEDEEMEELIPSELSLAK